MTLQGVFVLFELESMTGSDIAQALGIPTGTVPSKSRSVIESSVRHPFDSEQRLLVSGNGEASWFDVARDDRDFVLFCCDANLVLPKRRGFARAALARTQRLP